MSNTKKIGPYYVLKTIGRGSFGIVTAVKDENGKIFVVKQLDMSCMSNKEKMNVVNEVKFTLSLLGIKKLLLKIAFYMLLWIIVQFLFLSFSLNEEGDLSICIKKNKEMKTFIPESRIKRWLLQIITAIKFIHDKKLIHRDLKCNNIFLDEYERAKIGDFGLAKLLENTEQTNTLCGTIGYMAPEVCKNMPYSFPADIWSLGVILYELISLKQPFKSKNENMLSVVQKICEDEPSPLPTNYSEELISLCYWMLKKNSDERPTAYDIIATDYLQGEIQELHLLKSEILNKNEVN
ncbi:NIMA related kinase 2, putative [Plasmodium gallinaceum]|uniref:non-specific serine/threonine protein kinase n=1 Tax=Plasmodium gallinaceum TaxID=5849 RepID=A0A1J1GL27_PLAGA|nr:NIMA related kinase 2, putative [Plasmodium gallinaceum]CRG93028.1 NIMA related kinase 2, putative [Plasmodium gallinaceum]